MQGSEKHIQNLLDKLKTLGVEGPSLGGPYVGISHNTVTRAIVSEGHKLIPFLTKRLNKSSLNETIFIVFCLRELHAKSAKGNIEQLQRSKRFKKIKKDMTLDMQIEFFLRDVDSW